MSWQRIPHDWMLQAKSLVNVRKHWKGKEKITYESAVKRIVCLVSKYSDFRENNVVYDVGNIPACYKLKSACQC